MVSSIIKNDQASILSRAIDAVSGGWPEEIARGVQSITIAPADVERMNALAQIAQSGELSPEQEIEIENYRQAGRVLELLKAKAMISLSQLAGRTV